MKKIFILLAVLFITANGFAQHLGNIHIDPNQSKNFQYLPISSNGKDILSNARQPYGPYETKGDYKGVLLTDFADAIGNYIVDNDFISVVNLFTDDLTMTKNVHHYGDRYNFFLDTLGEFRIMSSTDSRYQNQIDFSPQAISLKSNFDDGAGYVGYAQLSLYGEGGEGKLKFITGDTSIEFLAYGDRAQISANESSAGYSYVEAAVSGDVKFASFDSSYQFTPIPKINTSPDYMLGMKADSIVAVPIKYKEYVAKIVQSGTGNPTATILQNDLTGTPTWTRTGVGTYRCTLTNQFTLNKCIDLVVHDFVNGSTYFSTGSFVSDDYYEMYSTNQTHSGSDNAIFWVSFKVYN